MMDQSVQPLSVIRRFTEKDGVLIFDRFLDQHLSSYDPSHLEEMVKIESEHFWFVTRREKICNLFEQYVSKSARILEIGTGTGFVAKKLQDKGFSIDVSDCCLSGLIFAQKSGIKRLYQFDLFHPPFQETFDVICLFDVLEHLKDDKLALLKIKQMLKPKGKIILTVPAHMCLWSREDAIAGHHIRYNKNELERLFHSCGFTPIYVRYFFILISPFLYLRKWIKPDLGNPVQSSEKFQFGLPKTLNKLFYLLTKFEFLLGKLVPNFFGGSLIAIAQKKESCM